MKLYRFVTLLIILILLVACVPPGPTPEPGPVGEKTNAELQGGKPFRFISCNRQHPVVRTMALGFWEACEKYGVECVDNSFDGVDTANMTTQADIAIAQGSSGAIPLVDKSVYEADKKIIAAGIPSVAIHIKVAKEDVPGLTAWVSADQADYATRAAIAMGEKMGGVGTVVISQENLNDVENEVSAVFTATMKEKFPDIKVLDPVMEGFDPPAAIAVGEAALRANPEITGAFGTTGGSPTTWAKAAEQVGKAKGELVIIGMDYTRQNLDLVKDGSVFALVGQPLYEEVYRAVELLVDNLHGKKVEYENVYPAPIITKETIDTYYGYADRVDAGLKE